MNLRTRYILAIILCLGPIAATLIMAEEYWPFTYFPMYAAKSDQVSWAQVRGVNRDTGAEEVLVGEPCFYPYGNIRFNYSMLNFAQSESPEKGRVMLGKLAKRIPENDCRSAGWSHLRAYLVWVKAEDQEHWNFRRPTGERRLWEVPIER